MASCYCPAPTHWNMFKLLILNTCIQVILNKGISIQCMVCSICKQNSTFNLIHLLSVVLRCFLLSIIFSSHSQEFQSDQWIFFSLQSHIRVSPALFTKWGASMHTTQQDAFQHHPEPLFIFQCPLGFVLCFYTVSGKKRTNQTGFLTCQWTKQHIVEETKKWGNN